MSPSPEGSPSTQPAETSGSLNPVGIGFTKISKCLRKTVGQEAGLAKGLAHKEEKKAV